MDIETQVIIGIPGKWPTRSDIVKDIANKSNGLLFAGLLLMDTATNDGYTLEVHSHDPDLTTSFEIAGPLLDIQAIRSHTFTLYLLAKGGSLGQAQKVLDVGCGLLQAGGLAVKVETTGKAHTYNDWFALASAHNETALYHAFVTLVGSNGAYHSCGMHNLGQPDAMVTGNITSDDAAGLLESFLLYLLTEKPALIDGHTFSAKQDSPHYRMRAVPCDTYPSDHPFFNPFGMWQLEVVLG
jgi:hypothetical protein